MYVNEATEQRLMEENKTRVPMIKQIIDAAPMFKEADFDGWTTPRIADLRDRVTRAGQKTVDESYAKVGGG